MRASTQTSLKERKSFQMSNFLGLDIVNTPYKVDSRRASEMSNFMVRDGTVRKRKGWKTLVHKYGYEILNIVPFTEIYQKFESDFKRKVYLLFYTKGDRLLYIDRLDENFSHLGTLLNGQNFGGEKPQVFLNKDMAYIITGYDYLVYGRMSDANKYNYGLRSVHNDSMTYIPTTTIGIEKDEDGIEGKRATKDAINLLSDYRYNTLIGSSQNSIYTLDGTPVIGSIMEIEFGGFTSIKTVADGNPTIFKDSRGSDSFEYSSTTNKLKILGTNLSTRVEGEPNIKVKFKCNSYHKHINEEYPSHTMIDYCTFGVLFGTSNETSRLFLSGNSYHKNMDIHSEYDDFTYFPDLNYRYLGSDTYAITGYARLNDNVLCVFKEENPQEATIWFRTAEYDGQTTQFFDSQGTIGETAIGNTCNVNFYGDSMILTKNGLFGIVQTNNYQTNQRYAIDRTKYIAPVFKDKNTNLSTSTIVIHKDNLYITFDHTYYVEEKDADGITRLVPVTKKETYVCDRNYNNKNSSTSNSFCYEWWKLDGIDASCYMSDGNNLYFCTNDGKIKKFYDGYEDLDFTEMDGSITIDMASGNLHTDFTSYSRLKAGDKLKLSFGIKLSVPIFDGIREKQISAGDIVYVSSKYQDDLGHNYICLKAYEKGAEGRILDHDDSSNITMQLIKNDPIEAYWVTPLFDFGTAMASKTLLGITLSAEQMLNGQLEFGYQTSKEITGFEQKGLQLYDAQNTDYTYYSFATGFQNSYSKKMNVRNFTFIKFKFKNKSNTDFAINVFSILYKFNKKNIGVR